MRAGFTTNQNHEHRRCGTNSRSEERVPGGAPASVFYLGLGVLFSSNSAPSASSVVNTLRSLPRHLRSLCGGLFSFFLASLRALCVPISVTSVLPSLFAFLFPALLCELCALCVLLPATGAYSDPVRVLPSLFSFSPYSRPRLHRPLPTLRFLCGPLCSLCVKPFSFPFFCPLRTSANSAPLRYLFLAS